MKKILFSCLFSILTLLSFSQKNKNKDDLFSDNSLTTTILAKKLGFTNIDDIGCVANNNSIDNGKIINDYLATQRNDKQVLLVVPLKQYHFSTTINLWDRTVSILGLGSPITVGSASSFVFDAGIAGIQIRREKNFAMGECIIENMDIRAIGKAAGDKVSSGIRAWQRCIIRNCNIYNFGYRGIEVWGDINPYKNDANVTKILYNRVASCGEDGIFVVGADSNACLFLKNNVVDCGGYGCNDNSFLGNMWYGNDTNNNKKGGYHAINPTNQSTFSGNYEEFNQPVSVFNAPVKITGGNLRK